MVRLFGLTQVHPSVLQLLRPHSDSLMLESTLTKTVVDVDWEKPSLGLSRRSLAVRNTTVTGFQFRTKASVCVPRAGTWDVPSLRLQMQHWFVPFSLFYFNWCLSCVTVWQNIFGNGSDIFCCIASCLWKSDFFLLSVVKNLWILRCMDERYCLHTMNIHYV